MTVLSEREYEVVMAELRKLPPTPERKRAISILKTNHIRTLVRESNAANNPSALLRRQAE